MTTAESAPEEVTEPESTPEDDGPKGKKARDWDRIKSERDDARIEVRDLTFERVGLDPTKGMGKAIAATYSGSYGREGVNELIEFARDEFDVELTDVAVTPTETTAKPEVSQGEHRLKQIDSGSTPAEPDARQEEQRQAEEQGDVKAFIASSLSEMLDDGTIGKA